MGLPHPMTYEFAVDVPAATLRVEDITGAYARSRERAISAAGPRDSHKCRYCGVGWVPWPGTQLDGHARCIVTPDFQDELWRLWLVSRELSLSVASRLCGVPHGYIKAWLAYAERRHRRSRESPRSPKGQRGGSNRRPEPSLVTRVRALFHANPLSYFALRDVPAHLDIPTTVARARQAIRRLCASGEVLRVRHGIYGITPLPTDTEWSPSSLSRRPVSETYQANYCRDKRAANKAAGRCRNDTKNRSHGPPVAGGVLCESCLEARRKRETRRSMKATSTKRAVDSAHRPSRVTPPSSSAAAGTPPPPAPRRAGS
jgi:hypothetical protein